MQAGDDRHVGVARPAAAALPVDAAAAAAAAQAALQAVPALNLARQMDLIEKTLPRVLPTTVMVDALLFVDRRQLLLFAGGKSMGGRVASMIADQLQATGRIAGLLCLGYPFHPVGKPDQRRTAHLADLRTPTLIVQGTRDPFGTRAEVASYQLSKSIDILWLEDGDHSFKPRRASGFTAAQHLEAATSAVAEFVRGLP